MLKILMSFLMFSLFSGCSYLAASSDYMADQSINTQPQVGGDPHYLVPKGPVAPFDASLIQPPKVA